MIAGGFGKTDDQIKIFVIKIGKAFRLVRFQIDADLIHDSGGKAVRAALGNAA